MTNTIITHFANVDHKFSILSDRKLKLEGCNMEKIIKDNARNGTNGFAASMHWKGMKMQYKLIGRYVWFTEENFVNCNRQKHYIDQCAFTFDANKIGAERWVDVAKRLSFKSKKARVYIKIFNDNARANGDDITKWWVCKKEVDLAFSNAITEAAA